jgi:hypothetical protein
VRQATSRPGLPDPLSLRTHLDAATPAEIEEFRRFWLPHERRELRREQLVERLERAMSDENVLYAKVELLSEKVRAVLLALLRAANYAADLQGVFRGVEGVDMEYYEAEAALTALARRGFVRVARAREWLHFGRSTFALPAEMAEAMRGLAGADRRPFDQVFLRASYRPSALEDAATELPAEVPASVEAAAAALPTASLRLVAREALERFGGILTRQEFRGAFASSRVAWQSRRFRDEFGRRGLGTVGHVDLRTRGLGVDDDALLLFHEVVERWSEEQRQRPLAFDRVLRAHGDLMSDVVLALEQIQDASVRVGKEGSVYKAARARLAESLVFPEQRLLDRQEVADRALALVQALGLARNEGEGRLAVTDAGRAWPALPLPAKVRAAYDALFRDGSGTLRSQHLSRLQAHIGALLMEGDAWFPGRSLALRARNRYLLELAREPASPSRPPLAARPGALTELAAAAHDLVVRDLFALGVIEAAVRGDEVVGVRLSALGRTALRGAGSPSDNGARALVVNPDFEMLVFPEGGVDELLHALDRIAVRVRSGEVAHYRLDRERVERAAVGGYGAEAIIAFLRAHARAPVPQNVEYSLREWSAGVRSASLARGILFTASDPRIVEAILHHPALKECVERVLDERTLFFNERALERQVSQELRALGVYVL